jgi:integrase
MTLVRKSELMLAQWKDLHLDKDEWHIPVENSKTGKPHIVYLPTQAQTLFQELKPLVSSSDGVLPGRGTLAKPFANNALNHTIGGVRGVYNRAEYAEQRREMLQAWAD